MTILPGYIGVPGGLDRRYGAAFGRLRVGSRRLTDGTAGQNQRNDGDRGEALSGLLTANTGVDMSTDSLADERTEGAVPISEKLA